MILVIANSLPQITTGSPALRFRRTLHLLPQLLRLPVCSSTLVQQSNHLRHQLQDSLYHSTIRLMFHCYLTAIGWHIDPQTLPTIVLIMNKQSQRRSQVSYLLHRKKTLKTISRLFKIPIYRSGMSARTQEIVTIKPI